MNKSTSRRSRGFLVKLLAALVIVLVVLTALFIEKLSVQKLREPLSRIHHFYTVMIRWVELLLDRY